jgi:hypothetical protein
MPGVVKIGSTERRVEDRVSELSSHTGVGMPYKAEASFPVADPLSTERNIHSKLDAFRVNQNREFFRISVAEAVATIRAVLGLPAIENAKPSPSPVSKQSFSFEPSPRGSYAKLQEIRAVWYGGDRKLARDMIAAFLQAAPRHPDGLKLQTFIAYRSEL